MCIQNSPEIWPWQTPFWYRIRLQTDYTNENTKLKESPCVFAVERAGWYSGWSTKQSAGPVLRFPACVFACCRGQAVNHQWHPADDWRGWSQHGSPATESTTGFGPTEWVTHTHTHTHTFILLQLLMKSGQILKHLVLCIAKLVNSCKKKLNDWGYVHTSSIGLKQFYRNYQWHKCTLIGQTHTKRRLPGIFRKPCKNIYGTSKTMIMAFRYLLYAALCSWWYVTLHVVVGDLKSLHTESEIFAC